ncbi:MAG: MFS transporter [Puniceicoccaceae bacterium]
MSSHKVPRPSELRGNLRRFVLFRLFFNVRFYYPVFTILYLDYGLTLEQFAILNLVWALTIVVAEVPSGALADIVGRKRLLVFAAFLMFIEMVLLVWVPIGASSLLFIVFLFNRICSGLAEAAASGADEALAYDSLKELGREDDWPALLEKVTIVVSVGFFIGMNLGALAYEPNVVNTLLGWIRPGLELDPDTIIRLPIIFTLFTSCIVIIATIGMKETGKEEAKVAGITIGQRLSQPFVQVFKAASWTIGHRFILMVILAALALDSVARQFVVLASEYYRIIDIPPAWFGLIGAGMSLLGMVNAKISKYLVTHHTPCFNFMVLSAILMIGLVGITFTIPWFGVVFAIGCFIMMGMVAFQSSYYLNKEVDSAHRATVLSFRGLALNLGLGLASLFYTGLIAFLKKGMDPALDAKAIQETVFAKSLISFPLYFLLLFVALVLAWRVLKPSMGGNSTGCEHPGE